MLPRGMLKRWILGLAGFLVTMEVVVCIAAYIAMRQTPDVFGRLVARTPMPLMMAVPFEPLWTRARGGVLKVGDAAPDFQLPELNHASTVQLSSLRGRPVVLVFGSYT